MSRRATAHHITLTGAMGQEAMRSRSVQFARPGGSARGERIGYTFGPLNVVDNDILPVPLSTAVVTINSQSQDRQGLT